MLTADRRPSGKRVSGGITTSMPIDSVSRRREPRMPLRKLCRVRLYDSDQQVWIPLQGQTVNVSPQGVGLLLSVPVPVGSLIEASVITGEDECRTITGRVQHQRQMLAGAYEIGVRIETEPYTFG